VKQCSRVVTQQSVELAHQMIGDVLRQRNISRGLGDGLYIA
jgi:hypothetical protein